MQHENGDCDCELPDEDDYDACAYKGYCIAGLFIEGCINTDDFIDLIKYD